MRNCQEVAISVHTYQDGTLNSSALYAYLSFIWVNCRRSCNGTHCLRKVAHCRIKKSTRRLSNFAANTCSS
jgi:hypothetical protein